MDTHPHQVRILWVQDLHEGPLNGLCEFKGEKLWFSRISESSSTQNDNEDLPTRSYVLYKLDPEMLQIVEDNHIAYCNETGSPLNHGDPTKFKRRTQMLKGDLSKCLKEGSEEEGVEATQRSLSNVVIYNHTFNSREIYGEYVSVIKETDFSNYSVPHRIEF